MQSNITSHRLDNLSLNAGMTPYAQQQTGIQTKRLFSLSDQIHLLQPAKHLLAQTAAFQVDAAYVVMYDNHSTDSLQLKLWCSSCSCSLSAV